jgi:rhodanese-related sulfurtransferase
MPSSRILAGVVAGAFALVLTAPVLAQQAAPAPAAKPQTSASSVSFDPAVARRMTTDELKRLFDAGEKVTIVDTRANPLGPVAKGAQTVPYKQITAWAKDVSKDSLIVVYCLCRNESTSSHVVVELQKLGFTRAFALVGGLKGYEAAGLPVEIREEPTPA